jgi:hypothetical protein
MFTGWPNAAQTRRGTRVEVEEFRARRGPPASAPETLRVTMWAGLREALCGFSYTGRPGTNNPLGQAHSPAIVPKFKSARLAGLPPSLRFGAP